MPHAGILVIDKPEGPTSFDVVARMRRVFHTREIGHCGTLDPLATGVLVVAVGSYTRLVRVLTADDKRYRATIAFGRATATDDREGDTVATGDASALDAAQVRRALDAFAGEQEQVPPAYSAIHVDGERAHALARRGEAPQMKSRSVVMHALSLVSYAEGIAVVDVHCGKGTYVRALARDLGAKLQVPAHLHALRRTASGAYTLADAVALDALTPHALHAGASAVRGVPLFEVSETDARALRQGKRVHAAVPHVEMALLHLDDAPVALARAEDGHWVVERGFPTQT